MWRRRTWTFCCLCYQVLGDARLLDPIVRGMNAFIVTQLGPPQAGWGLQHTLDLLPAGARTYEPKALVTHTSATNIELLVRFYDLTGETKFLARIPQALEWLDKTALPPGVAPPGRTHPTFVELGTNEPLYVHREGSNVFNGRYFVDKNPKGTIQHYSSFRRVDVAGAAQAVRDGEGDAAGRGHQDVAAQARRRYGAAGASTTRWPGPRGDAAAVAAQLNAQGYWLAPLGYNSHPYKRDGSKTPAARRLLADPRRRRDRHVAVSRIQKLMGISIEAYVRNMGVLIRALDASK